MQFQAFFQLLTYLNVSSTRGGENPCLEASAQANPELRTVFRKMTSLP